MPHEKVLEEQDGEECLREMALAFQHLAGAAPGHHIYWDDLVKNSGLRTTEERRAKEKKALDRCVKSYTWSRYSRYKLALFGMEQMEH